MIFGKTDAEIHKKEAELDKYWAKGIRKFAFLPERLYDGRFVWLRHYYSYRGILQKHVSFDEDGKATLEYIGSNYCGSKIRNYLEEDEEHILWKN